MKKLMSMLVIGAALGLAGCPDRAKAPETSEQAKPVSPEEAKAQADALLKEIDSL